MITNNLFAPHWHCEGEPKAQLSSKSYGSNVALKNISENPSVLESGRGITYPCRSNDHLHPAIAQLFALGYKEGDRVTGRCTRDNSYSIMWEATLTSDNLDLWRLRKEEKEGEKKKIWVKSSYFPDGLSFLTELNKDGYNIFFNVHGGANNKEVEKLRVFIYEIDTASLAEQWSILNRFPLAPTLVVHTGNKSFHVYYEWDCEETFSEEQKKVWKETQEYLSLAVNGDPAIKDISRLFRLAGFTHANSGREAEIKVLNPVAYTQEQVSEAIHHFYPDCYKDRYFLYQTVAQLNSSKDYSYDIPNDYAYKFEEKDCKGEKERLKLYAKAIREGDRDRADYYWNAPLKEILKSYKEQAKAQEQRRKQYQTVKPDSSCLNTVSATLASRYAEGFEEDGREDFHTCRCPVHSGESSDSLHIQKTTGSLICQSGCDPQEIDEELRRLARAANDPLGTKTFLDFQLHQKREDIHQELSVSPDNVELSRYFNDIAQNTKALDSSVLVLKGTMGVGKSVQMEKLCKKALQEEKPVFAITHRRILTRDLARKFNIPYVEDENSSNQFCKGLCIHSLHSQGQGNFSPEDARGAYIFIDEVDQTLWEAVQGEQLKYRTKILKHLKEAIPEALNHGGKVVLASAHFDKADYNLFKALTGVNPYVIENTFLPASEANTKAHIYQDASTFYKSLEEDIKQDKQALVFVPGQKEDSTYSSIALEKEYQEKFPNKKILRIDSQSTSTEGHEAFGLIEKLNQDPTILNQYDIVIVTTVLGTGVSLDQKAFDAVYCHAGGYALSTDVAQMIMRERNLDIPRHILRNNNVNQSLIAKGSLSPHEIYSDLCQKAKEVLLDIENASNPFGDHIEEFKTESESYKRFYIQKIAKRNADFTTPQLSLRETLEAEGFTIIEASSLNKEEQKSIKKDKKERKNANKQEKAERIANSPNPSDEDYQKLKDQKDKLKAERRDQLEKGAISRRYGLEADQELVTLDMDNYYPKFRAHYYLTKGRDFLESKEYQRLSALSEGNGSVFISDINRSFGYNIRLLEKLGLKELLYQKENPETGFPLFTNEGLTPWFNKVTESHESELKELGIKFNSDTITPISLFRKILREVFGLNLKEFDRKRKGNDRYRRYKIEDECQHIREKVFANWFERDRERQRVSNATNRVPELTDLSQGEPFSLPEDLTPVDIKDDYELKAGDILAFVGKFPFFQVITSTGKNVEYLEVRSGKSKRDVDLDSSPQELLDREVQIWGDKNIIYKLT